MTDAKQRLRRRLLGGMTAGLGASALARPVFGADPFPSKTVHVLVGYDAGHTGGYLLLVLPMLAAVSFFLIADLDSPRGGLIRVTPRNLISLSETLGRS